MKKILAFILTAIMLVSVFAVTASAEAGKNKDSVIKAAYGTPVIDGTVDTVWSKATAVKFDSYDWVTKSSSVFDAGQFRALWDENYIYLLYEINDTTTFTEELARSSAMFKDWYMGDGIGISFGTNWTNTNADRTDSIWAIVKPHAVFANFSADNAGVFITDDTVNWGKVNGYAQNDFVNLPLTSRYYATKVTSTGYVIEMKVKLSASKYANIAAIKLEAGAKIPFDTWCYGNDKTTVLERTHVYTWADKTCSTTKNNSLKGTMELLAKPNPTTGDSLYVVAALAVVAVLGTAVVVKRKFN